MNQLLQITKRGTRWEDRLEMAMVALLVNVPSTVSKGRLSAVLADIVETYRRVPQVCHHCGRAFEASRPTKYPRCTACDDVANEKRYVAQEARRLRDERERTERALRSRRNYHNRTGTPYQRFSYAQNDHTEARREELRTMRYGDFLLTDYWRAVRDCVVYRAGGRCVLCGSSSRLNVHHRSYEHHGEEHLHLGDLITLCHRCHGKFHAAGKVSS